MNCSGAVLPRRLEDVSEAEGDRVLVIQNAGILGTLGLVEYGFGGPVSTVFGPKCQVTSGKLRCRCKRLKVLIDTGSECVVIVAEPFVA